MSLDEQLAGLQLSALPVWVYDHDLYRFRWANKRALELVESQRQQILSLSAPIIDVGQLILAVPIIGEVREGRAGEITRRLLPAVQAQKARFVILDLTGCAMMDEAGARALLQLIQATELLGSRAVITGVPAALAIALIDMGVDLSSLQTQRTLREGLEFCRHAIG